MSLQQVESLFPLAIQWASEAETNAIKLGEPLNQIETEYARSIGVLFPERVRLLKVAVMPTPTNPVLKKAADEMGAELSNTDGLTLRYAIFIRQRCWRRLRLIVHELAHTHQYERAGGLSLLRQFILEYPDYPKGSLEQEAIAIERHFFDPSRPLCSDETVLKEATPAYRVAEQELDGVDASLLEDSLAKTPWERMQANDDALNFGESLRTAMERRNAESQ